MSAIKIGVIGGSGVYKIEGIEVVKEHKVLTPFGSPSSEIIEARLNGVSFYFLPRHGKHHSLTPSEINYRANIFALKELGVEYLISVSAVGSLKEEFPPTTFVIVDQFIDWTKGLRERTFFNNGFVGHVSVAEPVEKQLRDMLVEVCKEEKIKYGVGGSYICIEGPQFSTKAESNIYRSFGASVIGMTNVPEAYLAKEAGMAFATIAMVTDYDCWKEEHCTLEEIMKVMAINNKQAHAVLKNLIPKINAFPFTFKKENTFAILSKPERMIPEQAHILEVLLR
ncbi:MAG: S-methyl-5'-thioadenosine phosphorylase [Bacteriovorax sp.]|jgi:5'-methylthioadenosine phosphorylase|nr:S-methyl-5'-thioadenosine phosphorylase [Bacteriovorax sp.]